MFAGKDGKVETAAVVGLICLLFLGFLLFIFVRNSALINVDVNAKETCKRSVEQYARLKLPGIDISNTDHINCPTRSITIANENEEKAKAGIAKAMYDCFDQFGAGELELFNTRRGSTDNYCIVCSKITFTDQNKKINGLVIYLTETTIPGKKITYYKFFKGGGVTDTEMATALTVLPYDVVDVSRQHAVVFLYDKATEWNDKLIGGLKTGGKGTAVGVTVGVIIGGAISGFFTGGAGWVATSVFVAQAGVVGGAIVGGPSTIYGVIKAPPLNSDWSAGVLFLPYDESIKQHLHCSEIPIKQK